VELNLVVLDREFVAQHLDEFHVGAAGRAGGNAHFGRRQRDVNGRPDQAEQNDRSQNGHKPGVAQERPEPIAHGMSDRFQTHGVSQCVRRRVGWRLRLLVSSKPLPQPQFHGERRTLGWSRRHDQILNTAIIAARIVPCVEIASLIAERAKI
jgi:hypothetical protein